MKDRSRRHPLQDEGERLIREGLGRGSAAGGSRREPAPSSSRTVNPLVAAGIGVLAFVFVVGGLVGLIDIAPEEEPPSPLRTLPSPRTAADPAASPPCPERDAADRAWQNASTERPSRHELLALLPPVLVDATTVRDRFTFSARAEARLHADPSEWRPILERSGFLGGLHRTYAHPASGDRYEAEVLAFSSVRSASAATTQIVALRCPDSWERFRVFTGLREEAIGDLFRYDGTFEEQATWSQGRHAFTVRYRTDEPESHHALLELMALDVTLPIMRRAL